MPAIAVSELEHRYGERTALHDVTFDVPAGSVFGLLGPNGGGKSTLFRILSTLLPVQRGRCEVLGHDVAAEPDAVRRLIGVTFQSPSLDPKLTVIENLRHHGHLYGLCGRPLAERSRALLARLGLADREGEIAERLSGGMKRRVEIAKGLINDPQVLLLDEPSTGLDPGARHDLWQYLLALRDQTGVTILVTTHLMDEADRCDRLAILDEGRLVALGAPDELRASIGGDCITIPVAPDSDLPARIRERFRVDPQLVEGSLRIEQAGGHDLVRDLVQAFPDEIRSISLGKPTLEDVFIQRTGRKIGDSG